MGGRKSYKYKKKLEWSPRTLSQDSLDKKQYCIYWKKLKQTNSKYVAFENIFSDYGNLFLWE